MPVLPVPQKTQQLRSFAEPLLAAGVLIALLYWGRAFWITSVTAIIIAFILEPFVGFVVRLRTPRWLASLVVCVVALLLLYIAGLSVYAQAAGIGQDFPKFGARLGDIVETVRQKAEALEAATSQLVTRKPAAPVPPPTAKGKKRKVVVVETPQSGGIQEVRIHDDHNPITDYLYAHLSGFYESLLMASFIPFLVYFMLSWRDHAHRSFLHFFQGEDRVVAARSLLGIGDMVRGYVVGNFLIGCILSVLSAGAFWLLGLQYFFLAGPVSGFLSLIPYVGLPLAIVPPLFLALAAGLRASMIVLILVLVAALHLIALNVFYPKVVGARVHLNPLVVTFALMFWGFVWDAPGLLLAIPMTAGVKAVCDNVSGLRPYGRFLGD